MQSIYLAGGCFWCTEAAFLTLKSIRRVTPGYIGGDTINPTYAEVCKGDTGHAEAIKCEYDPKLISTKKILDFFFKIHDPTQLNRQGNDIGTHYRSAIFVNNVEEKDYVNILIKTFQKNFTSKILTEVGYKKIFYEAEDYHHNYFNKNPFSGYCRIIIKPKLDYISRNFDTKTNQF